MSTSTHARRFSLAELAAGLLLGLWLGVGLMSWLGGRGLESVERSGAEQRAVITTMAVVDLVEAVRAADGDVQAAVVKFVELAPEVAAVRVVDVAARELSASTLPDDIAAGDLPRRLRREEKDLFDRGNELRSAIDTNREEGKARKAEILVEPAEDGGLKLSAPIEEGGELQGAVLLATKASEAAAPSGWGWGPAWILAAVLLLVVTGWPLRRRGLVPAVVAGLLAIVALAGFRSEQLARLGAERRAVETTIAEHVAHTAEHARSSLAAQGLAAVLEPTGWDLDRFRQPRGVLGADGRPLGERVEAALAPVRGRFGKVFWVVALLGLGLAAFIGLGAALRSWHTFVRHREAYGYVAPAMIGMLLLVFFPFSYGILLSFTDQTLYNVDQPLWDIWAGFDNYVKIITDFDVVRTTDAGKVVNYQNFYYTLVFTILWTAANVAIGVSVGLGLALALNTRDLAGKAIYRVLLILPWAVPNYITALVWKGMFQQQFGVVNQVIQMFGGTPIAWYDSPVTSFFTILATNGWLSFPFMMVVALGALQSIPADLYEAARVDGAGRWQQFWLITLPSLKPALVPAIILSVVWTFNMFNIPYLVSAGEPGGSTEILITGAYKIAFEQYRYGYSAAYSTIIFGILLIYGTWQNRVTKASEGV